VEAMRGMRWEQFCDKHGDEGRDMKHQGQPLK